MSQIKRLLAEEEENHHRRMSNRAICSLCTTEEALRKFVLDNATTGECSYCRRSATTPNAVDINELLNYAIESLYVEYRPEGVEAIPWDQEDSTWLATPYDLSELLAEELQPQIPDALWSEIDSVLTDEAWFERDALSLRPHERLVLSWRGFAEAVRIGLAKKTADSLPWWLDEGVLPPAESLEAVGDAIADLPWILSAVGPADTFWRARRDAGWDQARQLGTRPAHPSVRGGRMNFPGRPWFYGALDHLTAAVELLDGRQDGPLTMAPFHPVSAMSLLDITGLGLALPSIFDEHDRETREAVRFLTQFGIEISKPVEPGREQLYAGTQHTTEYFRTAFRRRHGKAVDGIMYRSAKRQGGTNVVLFVSHEECVDPEERRPPRGLVLDPTFIRVMQSTDVRAAAHLSPGS